MAALGEERDFTGKLRLPLPESFSGQPADWEEWSWNFKACVSMFEQTVVQRWKSEVSPNPITDAHFAGYFA